MCSPFRYGALFTSYRGTRFAAATFYLPLLGANVLTGVLLGMQAGERASKPVFLSAFGYDDSPAPLCCCAAAHCVHLTAPAPVPMAQARQSPLALGLPGPPSSSCW